MSNNTELKPCPFCSRELLEIQYGEHERRKSIYRYTAKVVCLNCFASVPNHGFDANYEDAKEKAIEAWNRRANYGKFD